jgi:hypothetical protein
MFLEPSDFIDKYSLSTGMYSTAKLTSYITKYEEQYLVQLLGATLYNQFISDLSGANPNVPQSPNFLKIFNAFNEDVTGLTGNGLLYGNSGFLNNGILQSNGILEMLKGFIYFEFTRDLMNQQTPYGNVKQMAENSIVVDSPHSLMWERYNEGQKTYSTIQEWIWLNAPLEVGQIVLYSFTAGTGYVNGTYDLTGGTGSGASVTIVTIAGEVTEVSIETEGINYEVGDVLTIDSGNLDSALTLSYVGIGKLNNFNGVGKTTAYWI